MDDAIRRRLALPLALCSVLVLTPALAAQSQAVREVVLQPALSGHVLLPVTIDGTGPHTFLLDTGATHTAIAQPVAESLGFESLWDRFGDVQALTTRFQAERFQLRDVQIAEGIAPIDLHGVVIPVSPDQPAPVAGLLGADAIVGQRYTLDFAGLQLRFDDPPIEHVDGEIDAAGLLLGTATVRGAHNVRVMLDSGSAQTIVNPRLERRVRSRGMVVRMSVGGIDGRVGGIDGRVEEDARRAVLRDLQLGGLCIEAVGALEADLDIFSALGWTGEPAMVIGMDILQFARIDVDRETGVFQVQGGIDEVSCAR